MKNLFYEDCGVVLAMRRGDEGTEWVRKCGRVKHENVPGAPLYNKLFACAKVFTFYLSWAIYSIIFSSSLPFFLASSIKYSNVKKEVDLPGNSFLILLWCGSNFYA